MSLPLVTVALFSFNQEKYIADAVCGMLAQDYYPLQIIISDDCSTDNTFKIIKNIVAKYDGFHDVLLNQNICNLGIGNHINQIMELSQGELVVASGGDDISLPNRVRNTVETWLLNDKKYLSLCSTTINIDENGLIIGKYPKIKFASFDTVIRPHARWIYGSSHAWHRSLFEKFGPLRSDVVSEDKAIGFRSLLLGHEIGCIATPLVKYRIHPTNITTGSTNIQQISQKIGTFGSYLDDMNKAFDLGYLERTIRSRNTYKDIKIKYENFILRKSILESNKLSAIIKIICSGKKLSFTQKRGLLSKRFST